MTKRPPVVLTIAGFDPSSGAGITADIKTIAAHNCYGVACITALTVQSTQGVRRVEAVAANLLAASMVELASDVEFAAVHIGMLGSADTANAIADFLVTKHPPNVVLDPVLRSTSGTDLLDQAALTVLIERLMPLATVLTPNLDEAAILTGMTVGTRAEMSLAAEKLHKMGCRSVVITGGHLSQGHPGELADLLSFAGQRGFEQKFFEVKRQQSNSTHGTGCAFSTAMACNLALGKTFVDAVSLAQAYVGSAISNAYPIGRGIGPINHLYKLGNE